ncbi:zinc ribbon domain-containing protein [Pediococcus acidilactici]|uniref:zinc ribbon domain-containing protein n=1 Tax=Pediococcus acidilactici TaxID=1254 RepID=UPI0002E01967|nr:zinc ribbon domain-containing protein [Pediococcus acidilactici]MDB8870757.1 zinc ribbon domain-containing protein [Pediococcus acidilactici]MDB8878504.1 zinc ribbon domain-containing protein [Pediococcus acidilactici]QIO84979.1 zinc ribbon domain-containing protein [Pediococcus acidilactici]QJW86468.1 zinc ribbon domain-containing protein [Pediococcus acidilactici]QYI95313.1 zinc ribbon domain-containing protein [Pediococcus acidilactici]
MEKRFCTKCGKEMPSDADYCSYCGLKQSQTPKISTKKKKSNSPKKLSNRLRNWTIIILVIIFTIVFICSFIGPSPEGISNDIKMTLKKENYGMEVISVKPDENIGGFKVRIKEGEVIKEPYNNRYHSLKYTEHTLTKLSKKYSNYDTDIFKYSSIELDLVTPNHSDKLLLMIEKGKIVYNSKHR